MNLDAVQVGAVDQATFKVACGGVGGKGFQTTIENLITIQVKIGDKFCCHLNPSF